MHDKFNNQEKRVGLGGREACMTKRRRDDGISPCGEKWRANIGVSFVRQSLKQQASKREKKNTRTKKREKKI